MSETQQNPEPVPPVFTPFAAPSEYLAALDNVLALAANEILVLDRDLRDGDWNSVRRAELLQTFLLKHRTSRLQIIVHETLFIEAHLPRLLMLLREFSHKVEIRRTIEDGRNAWDAYVLVDGKHALNRFHQNVMRGELGIDAVDKVRELRERYDEIMVFSEPGVNATQLGL